LRPLVHIIVLNWNGSDDTLACLASLECLDYDNYAVVVVDNGSKQPLGDALMAAHPRVVLIENDINLGYAAGNNVGMRFALEQGAAFVWVLNNDTVVEPDALSALVSAAEQYPRCAAVGGRVCLGQRRERLWVAWGRVTWLQSLIALDGQNAIDGAAYDGQREVEWLPGCSLLFRADSLKRVGLFDEDYFAYHEDVEWAARARLAGWQLRYTGDSRVYHSVHGSSGGEAHYGGFRKYLSARNSVLYARKYGSFSQKLLMAAAIIVTLPFQFLRRLVSGEQAGIYMKLRGWRDGLLGRPLPLVELGLREKT